MWLRLLFLKGPPNWIQLARPTSTLNMTWNKKTCPILNETNVVPIRNHHVDGPEDGYVASSKDLTCQSQVGEPLSMQITVMWAWHSSLFVYISELWTIKPETKLQYLIVSGLIFGLIACVLLKRHGGVSRIVIVLFFFNGAIQWCPSLDWCDVPMTQSTHI